MEDEEEPLTGAAYTETEGRWVTIKNRPITGGLWPLWWREKFLGKASPNFEQRPALGPPTNSNPKEGD